MKTFKRKRLSQPLPADPTAAQLSLSDVDKAQHGRILLRALYKQLSSKLSKSIPSRDLVATAAPAIPPFTAPQSLALSSLIEALRSFSMTASEIPRVGSILKCHSDILAASLKDIQETPGMAGAFLKLGEVVRSMRDFLRKVSTRSNNSGGYLADPTQAETDSRLVHEIQQQMVTLTSDVHAAVTQGTHASFFDTSNGTSAISSRVSEMQVILGAITEIEGQQQTGQMQYYRVEESHVVQKSVYAEGASVPVTREFKNLVAGQGGSGGKAQEGGSGGDGGGFTISMDVTQSYKFDGLQTGAGGEGGEGTVKGGVGGSAGWFKIG